MREILFRGKRTDNGEWVYWNKFAWFVDPTDMSLTSVIEMGRPCGKDTLAAIHLWANRPMIDENTICEAVRGWKDKNGKRIFEGDIIRYESGFGVVTWAENHCAFMCVEENGQYWEWFDNIFSPSIEVVGNKWDNKNLIEERNEGEPTDEENEPNYVLGT